MYAFEKFFIIPIENKGVNLIVAPSYDQFPEAVKQEVSESDFEKTSAIFGTDFIAVIMEEKNYKELRKTYYEMLKVFYKISK